MWNAIQQLAFPSRLYRFCSAFIPWLGISSLLMLSTGLVWGFVYAPANPLQGHGYRILYLNIPATIVATGMYIAMMVAAFIALARGRAMANLAVAAIAPVGAMFAFISLVTGMAWEKPYAGNGWIWEGCLTSELVLMLLYCGIVGLRHACSDPQKAGRAMAILVLAGGFSLPLIHQSLLEGTQWVLRGFVPAMHSPLHLATFGFLALFATLVMMRLRNLILSVEKCRPWVSELILERG